MLKDSQPSAIAFLTISSHTTILSSDLNCNKTQPQPNTDLSSQICSHSLGGFCCPTNDNGNLSAPQAGTLGIQNECFALNIAVCNMDQYQQRIIALLIIVCDGSRGTFLSTLLQTGNGISGSENILS